MGEGGEKIGGGKKEENKSVDDRPTPITRPTHLRADVKLGRVIPIIARRRLRLGRGDARPRNARARHETRVQWRTCDALAAVCHEPW